MAEATKPSLVPVLKEDGANVLSQELSNNFSRLRRLASEEGQRKKKRSRCEEPKARYSEERYQLALWTAAMAESEINNLERGIEELEALLDDEEEEEEDNDDEGCIDQGKEDNDIALVRSRAT